MACARWVYISNYKRLGVIFVISELLLRIEEFKNRDNKSIMTPANDKDIQLTKEWVSKNVNENLWVKDHEAFLKKANGLEFNGLVIYNANPNDDNNGIIGANEIWRENDWDSNYLFFGDSNISWYSLDVDNNVFVELDKPSGEVVEEFENFNEMLEEAINSVLP